MKTKLLRDGLEQIYVVLPTLYLSGRVILTYQDFFAVWWLSAVDKSQVGGSKIFPVSFQMVSHSNGLHEKMHSQVGCIVLLWRNFVWHLTQGYNKDNRNFNLDFVPPDLVLLFHILSLTFFASVLGEAHVANRQPAYFWLWPWIVRKYPLLCLGVSKVKNENSEGVELVTIEIISTGILLEVPTEWIFRQTYISYIRGRLRISFRFKQKLCLPDCTENSSKTAVQDGGERSVPGWRSRRVVVSVNQHWPALLAGVRQSTVDCPAVVDEGGACGDAGREGGRRVLQTISQADI